MSYEQLAQAVDNLAVSNSDLKANVLVVKTSTEQARDAAQAFAINAVAVGAEVHAELLTAEMAAEVAAGVKVKEGVVNHNRDAGAHPEMTAFISSEASRATIAADAAQLSVGIFDTVLLGQAATTNGKYYSVPSLESTEYLVLYKNNAGTALEVKRYPSTNGISQSTPNLWPDPFFKSYFTQYGKVSSIVGRMFGDGVFNNTNPNNPFGGVSVDIPAGAGIRNTAFFVPLSELGSFKNGDRITAKVIVVTSGQVRLDLATRDTINSAAIQSAVDYKVGTGVVELTASLTLAAPAVGLFIRVQLDDTNVNVAAVVAMIAGKGIGLGYAEKAVDSTEAKKLALGVVKDYKVPVLGTDIFRVGKNLYNAATRVAGSYININDFVIESATYFYSDYIPVVKSTNYVANVSLRFVQFYDSSKAFLGSVATLQSVTQFTAPSNAAFIRVSVLLAVGDGLQIEMGNAATTYEAYGYYIKTTDSSGTPLFATVAKTEPVAPAVVRPNSYGFEHLRETHQRLRCLSMGDAVRFNIGAFGDSWTHNTLRWVLPVFNAMKALYGGLGDGWVGLAYSSANLTNGSVRGYNIATLSGTWTCAYANGNGPDAGSVTSVTAGSGVAVNFNTYTVERNLYLLAQGGSGSISYSVAGGSAVTVNLASMSGVQKINLGTVTGPAAVTVTVVSGSVTLYGFIESFTGKGVGVHKLGSTGSRGAQWEALDVAKFRAGISALELDLAIAMLGTNDQLTPATKAAFKASIESMVINVRTARPTADILLVAPCENQRGLPTPMSDYADAMYELAVQYKLAFIDLQPHFGTLPSDYAAGSARPWFLPDQIHPDPATGGRAIVSAIMAPLVP